MTGTQSYDLPSTKNITANVPAGKQFIVSYWAIGSSVVVKSNGVSIGVTLTGLTRNGWTYYEHVLPNTTNAVTVTGTSTAATTIDELRLYPVDAQMTTYTYAPLMGMLTACSPANNITYYSYDALGRLSVIRDMDQNVVKEYQYQIQQLIKPVFNGIQSGVFNRSNCGTGYIGQSYTYVVPAGKYASYIGNDDANQQAINEVNANGQHFADSLALCYVQITCTNYVGASGFVATYTGAKNQLSWSFNIPSTPGLQTIGAIPAGPYTLTISKPGNATQYTFGNGCGVMSASGLSATFTQSVNNTTCNSIYINNLQ
jgi:YD repeat-containing protein